MNWSFWTQPRQPGSHASDLDSCDTIDPLLSLYADQMASSEEKIRVEAHLPGCESCRESLGWTQATRRTLSSRPVMLPPADLRARIAGAIAASTVVSGVRPHRVFALRPTYAAAASLSILGALVLGYSLLTTPKVTPQNPAPKLVAALPQAEADKPLTIQPPLVPRVIIKHPAPQAAKTNVSPELVVPDAAGQAPRETVGVVTPAPEKSSLRPVHAHAAPTAAKTAPKPSRLLMVRFPAANSLKHVGAVAPPVKKQSVSLEAALPPSVSVGPAVVTPQGDIHPMVASSPTSEGHFQSVSLLGPAQEYVLSHSSILEHNLTRVGNTAIRQAVRTSSLTGEEGGAVPVADIHSR